MFKITLLMASATLLATTGAAFARCAPIPTPEAGMSLGMLLVAGAIYVSKKRKPGSAQG